MAKRSRDKVTRPPEKPLLVYDGDCAFCRRWVARWESRTGDRITYATFQKIGSHYPEIPKEAFEKAVQLILPDGEVLSGAEAVFRTLAVGAGKKWPLWGYRYLPGAAWVAEWFYQKVARHRPIFSKWTHLLWGDQVEGPSYRTSAQMFLRLLGLGYLIAFVSLWIQVEGLVGSEGILPVERTLEVVRQKTGSERYWIFPTLCWLDSSDSFLHLLCGGGTLFSLLLIAGISVPPLLFCLWAFYLSLTTIGRDFLSFQWDNLLLEAGFLAIFLPPFSMAPKKFREWQPSPAVVWLLKWLLFRLMFSSGMVKLASGDPTWRSGTALSYHYETQPLPTWIGWFVHQLPDRFQKSSTVGMFVVELAVPFLIFAPRRLRHAGAILLIAFQCLIALTGNYCFFNLLTIALCVLLFEDTFWPQWLRKKESFSGRWSKWVITPLITGILLVTLPQMGALFRARIPWPRPLFFLYEIVSPFRSVNSYGLFAVMTTSRPEIIVEGSQDGITWHAYEFKYKPGDLRRKPMFVAPHQPRLDWQMWFAALSGYRERSWFSNFCIRLLQGSPDVLRLLSKNPFPDKPPRYIRALLYDYRFTDRATLRAEGAWWKRERLGFYSPILSLQEGRPSKNR